MSAGALAWAVLGAYVVVNIAQRAFGVEPLKDRPTPYLLFSVILEVLILLLVAAVLL